MNITKLSLPLTLVVSILAAAAGIGGTYKASAERLSQVEEAQKKHDADIDKLKDQRAEHAERLKGIETELKSMNRTLDRIDQKLK